MNRFAIQGPPGGTANPYLQRMMQGQSAAPQFIPPALMGAMNMDPEMASRMKAPMFGGAAKGMPAGTNMSGPTGTI